MQTIENLSFYTFLKTKVHSILSNGVRPDTSHYSGFIIWGINIFCFFGVIIATICIFLHAVTNKEPLVYVPVIIGIILYFSVIFLHSKYKYKLAKLLLFGLFPLIQFANLMFIEKDNYGIVLTIIPFAFFAILAFKNLAVRILVILYVLFLGFYPLTNFINPLGNYFVANIFFMMSGFLLFFHFILNHFRKNATKLQFQNNVLKQQNEKLEALKDDNDLKRELLAIISHDLKGPACSFNKLSQKVAFLIQNKRFEDLQQLGDYFESAGNKIFQNLDRLLDWTMSQKRNIVPQSNTVSPHRLIDEISQKLLLQYSDKKVSVKNVVPKDFVLTTDSQISEIILQNLLSNAVNNSPDHESIFVTSESSPSDFTLSISNKGEVMDMKVIELAKAGKFQKSKTGYGLGIGICFSLIEILNGHISYVSDKKLGTTVRVAIPYK